MDHLGILKLENKFALINSGKHNLMFEKPEEALLQKPCLRSLWL